MAHRFASLADSSAPSTPERPSRKPARFNFGAEPTTTPAGPPPSESNSFTPAGAPSASYLGSSIIRGMTGPKPSSQNFQSGGSGGLGRNLFGPKDSPAHNTRSARGAKGRGPSGLSQSIRAESVERETAPKSRAGTFKLAFDDFSDDDDDDDDDSYDSGAKNQKVADEDQESEEDEEEDEEEEDEDEENEEEEVEEERYPIFGRSGHRDLDAEIEELISREIAGSDEEGSEDAEGEEDDDEDPFLTMGDEAHDGMERSPEESEEDLMMLNTPAADARARQEAEDIFRASSMRRSITDRRGEFQFNTIARELYTQLGPALINETPDLILSTEDIVSRLYDEGIGANDDAEKLDNSLALAALNLTKIWNDYARELLDPEEEHVAEIGPGPQSEPFKKAAFVADLVMRMHHTRLQGDLDEGKRPPLPEILFHWMNQNHTLYPDQLDEVLHQTPNPACHGLFWQTVRTTLVRGDVRQAASLLREADFKYARKFGNTRDGPPAYSAKALENIEFAVRQTCSMLEHCPAAVDDWNIWASDWTLFRVKARASLDQLRRFAEGKDHPQLGSSHGNSVDDGGFPADGRESLAGLARKAESQIPWEIYEQLTSIYDIAIGDESAILETAQDWCEATVGLCGWWDEDKDRPAKRRMGQSVDLLRSTQIIPVEDSFDRLARAFHAAVESDFHFNPRNPVEVAVASVFEGNMAGVIGLLRAWSLPIACSAAEIAALGHWLPKPEPKSLFAMEALDAEDLEVLGVPPQGPDELEGIKDTTLVQYARELAGIDQVSPTKEGWEVAVQVLGRMDSVEKSEETVGELLHDILETLQPDSSITVDKMWRILSDLGMVSFAEETVETFAEILARDSHRYGEAIWYYALAHKPAKVRDILNLLTSYSLLNSTAYPPPSDLDDHLHRLLKRRSEALEDLAGLDIEAAQLVGRMLSGYATLRKFYEIRDSAEGNTNSTHNRKRQAAAALVAVIASSDDNIRGGLYDETRDAVVSEDFLLVLLGEALVLVGQDPPVLTLEQMDTLLKAIEDVQTVGSRVYSACDEFFGLALASAQGLRGSTPADLLKRSTSSLSGSSYVLTGSSMLASRLHRSISGSGTLANVAPRGWDWRGGLRAGMGAEEVLRILRLGLSKELAKLWLQEADNVALF